MAKKQPGGAAKAKPSQAKAAGLVLVRLQLPADVHGAFRVEAAKEGRSMANMARRLVEEWVASRTRRPGA